ncbi:MAG: hypothetical protein KDJ27_20695 [Gammaproteobacteria bacterium]|nr:hypothetical protein [Gammaproteobacteria bacterium]
MKAELPSTAIGVFLLVAHAVAAADDAWTCSKGALERSVTVYYPQAPATVPCRVYYGKRDENVIPRVIWSADHDSGYCEAKADAFVNRLRSWGWSCSAEATAGER